MGLAFWKNGCITPPFFEPYPYIWEGKIFHSSWSLEILFSSIFFWLKLEYTRTFISTINTELAIYALEQVHCWGTYFRAKTGQFENFTHLNF
jgi:hypothetical protein